LEPLDLNADLDALTDESLADEYNPAPEDGATETPSVPGKVASMGRKTPQQSEWGVPSIIGPGMNAPPLNPPPKVRVASTDTDDSEQTDLEPVLKSKALGDETAESLNFMSMFMSSAKAGEAEKGVPLDAPPVRRGKKKKAIEEPQDGVEPSMDETENIGAATTVEPEAEPGIMDTAKAVAKDVGKGVVQAPRQVLGGMADAVNNIVKLGDIMQEAVPLPGFQIFDAEGNWSPDLLSADEVTKMRKATDPSFLPTTDKPDTVTGGMVRSISQFFTGYRLGGKVFSTPAASTTAFFSRSTAQGLFSDFSAFDGHEQRLSNMVQSVPALANPITEYLAADPEDGKAEGRFKNAVEGLIPNAAVSVLAYSLKGIKAARAVKAATGGRTYTQAADALAENIRVTGELPVSGADDPFRLIGSSAPEAPLTNLKASDAATDLPVPTDVAAKGVANAAKGTDAKQAIGDTFINFARINSSDDIQAVIRDLAESQADNISKAQRGVVSNKETLAAASTKYDEVWTELQTRKTGDLKFNAEQQTALRQMWTASGEKLLETAKAAEAMPTAENLLAFRKMLTVHDMVQKQALAVRTETARALQAWNIPVGVAGKEKISAMQNILLQHGGTDMNIDLVRKFSALADEVAADPRAMAKVSKAAEKTSGARNLNAVSEAWMSIGLLSGPKTHIRNMISNTGMIAASVMDRAVAARAQGLIDDKTAVALGEASAQVAGTFGNVRKAWMDAVETFQTGNMKIGMSQIDIPPEMAMRSLDRNTLFGKTMYGLSYAASPVFKSLQASDQFFKTLNFEGEMSALAHRAAVQAVKEGKITADKAADFTADFLANPPQTVVDQAMEAASYRTFTNEPGPLTKKILNFRHEFPAARFIIPFVNTPANVFRTAVEYSPLAPVLSKYKSAIERGGADAALARARVGIGTTALLSAIDLTMEGKITGSGPEPGSAEFQALSRTGWKPYTIRIGDKWVSYRGIEPFSTILSIGADIGDYTRYAENDPDSGEAIKDMLSIGIFGSFGSMLDRSFLTGLANTIAAATDPERYGPRWVDSFASSFVPRALTEVRNSTDTTVRDARTMMDAFKTKIPYMSMTVPERRDEWGRTKSMESGWGKAYDALSPFYATPIKVEPIDKELIRQGFGAASAVRSMRLGGVSVSFANRADIHNQYLEMRGQYPAKKLHPSLVEKYGNETMLDVLNGMVTGKHPLAKQYAAGSDGEGGEKHKLIQKVVRDYGAAARKLIVEQYPEIREKVDTEQGKRRERATVGDQIVNDLLQ
jgi:hypothetical protein